MTLHAAFSPDARRLLVDWRDMLRDRCVQVWDTATGKMLWQHQNVTDKSGKFQFSKDGKHLQQWNVRLDAETGANVAVEEKVPILYVEASTQPFVQLDPQKQQRISPRQLLPDERSQMVMVTTPLSTGQLHELHWVERYTRETRLTYALPDKSLLRHWQVNPESTLCFAATGQRTIYFWKLQPIMRPGRPPLTTAELETHWETLQEQPAQPAWQAMQAMIHQPDRSVPFLAKILKPHPTLDRIPALIADLDSDNFQTRETASQALRNLGHTARAALEEAAKSNSQEQARRAKLILSSLRILDLETLRLLRALEVLERIGTPDAVKVIEQFAQQTTGLIKSEALASLTRSKP